MREVNSIPNHVWVKCNSHRARGTLQRIAGEASDVSYGRWPDGQWPSGEYYQVPVRLAAEIGAVKGLTVLKRKPTDLFRRVNFS